MIRYWRLFRLAVSFLSQRKLNINIKSGGKPYADGSDGKGLSANPIDNFCMFPVNTIFK